MENATPLSVAELNEYARRLLAGDPLLRNLRVTGEISGYKHHYSGHRYFTLKDDAAKVQCVMFRQQAMGLDFQPADGMQVTLSASASIFPRDGSYQLYVNAMEKAGKGDLYVRFEKLKQKLAAEGLFDPAMKRPIPAMPGKIGVVTSETGAAIRDIIQVARRRNPNIEILVAPCAVQGESAAGEIVRAIERLNENGECDVLLVGRGGGSIEDLWAFNEEIVARAIFDSKIPIVSCVGHEIDFTIADFVADFRAPTPSSAAELAVPVLSEIRADLDAMLNRLARALDYGVQVRKSRLNALSQSRLFTVPGDVLLSGKYDQLDRINQRLSTALKSSSQQWISRLNGLERALTALNPAGVLKRGYAVVEGDGGLITSAKNLGLQQSVTMHLSDGQFRATVENIKIKASENETNENGTESTH